MKYAIGTLLLSLLFAAPTALAGDKVEAAAGGAAGGAIGAIIGDELGDREGAIIGAAAGAAIGTAVMTSGDQAEVIQPPVIVVEPGHPQERFCPPGQAKKKRC
jgi:hypothetical protein